MKISIIIPVYNKSKYLRTILSQVRDQSFADFECLLIDDGSSDDSGIICDEFAAIDERFKVFHIKNGGVSHARNVGLDSAAGEYITFIDADDEINREYLENLIKCITENNTDIVISGIEKNWLNSDKKQYFRYTQKGVIHKNDILPTFAAVQKQTGMFGFCVGKLIRSETITGIRFDTGLKLAEDFDFYLKLYDRINTFYFDDECYYYYLQEAENSSVSNDDKIDYLAQLKINLRYRDFLIKQNAYSGENKAIVEKKLSDYVYFVLFHTPLSLYDERFEAVYKLYREEGISLLADGLFAKILFCCLNRNKCKLAKAAVIFYRSARKLKRAVKKDGE